MWIYNFNKISSHLANKICKIKVTKFWFSHSSGFMIQLVGPNKDNSKALKRTDYASDLWSN